MSSYSLASGGSNAVGGGSGSGAATPPITDQARALEDALAVVRVQAFHMKRCLDSNKLMDALKHASTMLSELRTSALMPKYYYELYMSIFDELRHLSTFLYDAHISYRHHLSDLYELVQYAANIVPRLYLMITVGSVFMRVSKETFAAANAITDSAKTKTKPVSDDPSAAAVDPAATDAALTQPSPNTNLAEDAAVDAQPDAQTSSHDVPPIKELMRDMLEMSRGVQHPTRGLFLRYYLSGLTRDYLPDVATDGPHGNIHDSIHFIIHNFIEMNKLWVRLQFQGHSRERDKREQERRELRLLVGSNLVRLSQLEDLTLAVYQSQILPTLLEEIVSCRDVIAQEYLMEVIIQVFPDDFHLRSLSIFLPATARLQRTVNVKQIVISLIDRFASYAARAREDAGVSASPSAKTAASPATHLPPVSGIPDEVKLFDVFWEQVTELVKARPEFTLQDIIALLLSLANLSLNCYPEELGYIDRVLGMAKDRVIEATRSDAQSLAEPKTRTLLLQLLRGPVQTHANNVLRILDFPSSSTQTKLEQQQLQLQQQLDGHPVGTRSNSLGGNYTDLLFLQPYNTRREIAHLFAISAIRAAINDGFVIDSADGVNFLLGEVCSIMVRDQVDGGLFGPKRKPAQSPDPLDEPELPIDWEDAREEQTHLAKLVHLFRAPDNRLDLEFLLLTTARNHFGEGGDIRIRFTLSPIVVALVKLARKYHYSHAPRAREEVPLILKTIHQTISTLQRAQEHFSDDSDGGVGGGGYKPLFKDDGAVSYTPPVRIGHGLMSPPDASLRLYLLSAQIADELRQEELCYEFFVQALTVYEESVSESKAQVAAITQIIGTLYGTTLFGYENYETLITKCAVHCSRLMKRVDQCRGVMMVSHLFWAPVGPGEEGHSAAVAAAGTTVLPATAYSNASGDASTAASATTGTGVVQTNATLRTRDEDKPAYRDGKRVLECLQKALKIADSVMDPSVNVELFVEILERYLWYYEHKNEMITIKYLNSLIDLVHTNLTSSEVGIGGSGGVGGVGSGGVGGGALAAAAATAAASGISGGPLSAMNSPTASLFITDPHRTRRISDHTITHFRNILAHMSACRDAEHRILDSASVVPGMSSGFAGHGGGRWGSIDIPKI